MKMPRKKQLFVRPLLSTRWPTSKDAQERCFLIVQKQRFVRLLLSTGGPTPKDAQERCFLIVQIGSGL